MNIRAIAKQIDMDYDNVLEDFCGDVAAISAKLENYLADCSFETLAAAVKADEAEAVKKGAHRIRKCSEKLGLTQMAKLASTLENAKADKATSAFEPLEKEYRKIEEVLTHKDEPETV